MKKKNLEGLIHVYAGDGKGKTTAAIGLGVRAALHGYDVLMIQFMKDKSMYGESNISKKIKKFKIESYGRPEFVDLKNPAEIDKEYAKQGMLRAREAVNSGKYDLIILDEINFAMFAGLVGENDVKLLVEEKPQDLELVLTGRYPPISIIQLADYLTVMGEVKHPFRNKGIKARKGIEY